MCQSLFFNKLAGYDFDVQNDLASQQGTMRHGFLQLTRN